jgi:hypothetical protein
MRGEMVFYVSQDESRRMISELDFLLRRVYGEDISKSRQQIASQVPNMLAFLLNLAQFMPGAIDLTQYLPRQ